MEATMLDGIRNIAAGKAALAVAGGLLALGACIGDSPSQAGPEVFCDLDQGLLFSSLPPNAIPALTRPEIVDPSSPDAEYLVDSDRVLGVYVNGVARAYPHNILWHHEIVNDTVGGEWVSVTFCPLTGSGLAFDPILDGERLDLGVSGVLFANNLVMYDRLTEGVYGPQLGVLALCEAFAGQELALMQVQEMSWGRWKELHPDTKVVSSTNGAFNYRVYPYGTYDQLADNTLLVEMDVERSRPIKERVLGIRVGDGGRGYPFGELLDRGRVSVVNEVVAGVPTAVFFEARNGAVAVAFDARVGAQTLTFDADIDGGIWTDRETGSTWTIDGSATAGPLAGERLVTRSDAYTLFWFAWRHFQPNGSTFPN